MNTHHLMRLAVFLNNLPVDYAHFNMIDFARRENGEDALPIEMTGVIHECGTTACAFGHVPFVSGIPSPQHRELWGSYLQRVFDWNIIDIKFLTDIDWNKIDGSAKYTAKRLWVYATHPVRMYNFIKYIHDVKFVDIVSADPLFISLMASAQIPTELHGDLNAYIQD